MGKQRWCRVSFCSDVWPIVHSVGAFPSSERVAHVSIIHTIPWCAVIQMEMKIRHYHVVWKLEEKSKIRSIWASAHPTNLTSRTEVFRVYINNRLGSQTFLEIAAVKRPSFPVREGLSGETALKLLLLSPNIFEKFHGCTGNFCTAEKIELVKHYGMQWGQLYNHSLELTTFQLAQASTHNNADNLSIGVQLTQS